MDNSDHAIHNTLFLLNDIAGDKLYDAFVHRHGRRHVTRNEYHQRTQRFHENKQMIEVSTLLPLLAGQHHIAMLEYNVPLVAVNRTIALCLYPFCSSLCPASFLSSLSMLFCLHALLLPLLLVVPTVLRLACLVSVTVLGSGYLPTCL